MAEPGPIGASIIVPSYNRPDRLARCLGALMAQQDDDFEVIVVDDGSVPPLAEICAGFGPRVRCLRQENAGAGPARNRAVAAARGAFLAFTDDDCLPRPDWLDRLRAAHGDDPARLVGGHVINGLPDNPYASASQDLCDYLYDYFGAAEGKISFFTTNNMGCARETFLGLGGFDESFPRAGAEDRDFGLRWRAGGGHLHYVPEALVDHYHGMTLKGFLKQHWNYGRGARILHRQLDRRHATTPKREPLRFYGDLVIWPLRQQGLAGLGRTFLMGLTQMATVAGYGYDLFQERRAGRAASQTKG